jgi:acetyl-CoA acetyltransferase
MVRRAVIVSAVRTAIGTFGGALSQVSAVDLGAVAVREAIARAGASVGGGQPAAGQTDGGHVAGGQAGAISCTNNPRNVLHGLGQKRVQAIRDQGGPSIEVRHNCQQVCGSG